MKLRYVNGYKIRQTLDPEFSIIHYHNPDFTYYDFKWYIPEDEIWFDSKFKGEEKFLQKILLADLRDREEARKFCKKGKAPDFVVKEETKDGLKIQYVDGKIVREYIDPEFVFGGHDLVYSYVPKETIWIDDIMDPKDIPHTLIHEIYERNLINKGKSYDVAHDYATAKEKESRREAGGVYTGDVNHVEEFSLKKYYVG